MASIPNTRPAPAPAPTGKAGAPAVDGADFALQIAAIPEGFLPPPALAADGAGLGATTQPAQVPAKTLEDSDPLVDAAQLAALIPVLPVTPPTTTPAVAPAKATGGDDPNAVAAAADAASVATPRPALPDVGNDNAAAKAAPLVVAGAIEVAPKAKTAKQTAEGATAADAEDTQEAGEAPDAPAPQHKAVSAKEAIAAARKAIEAALHPVIARGAETDRARPAPAAGPQFPTSPSPSPAELARPQAADPADAIQATSAAPAPIEAAPAQVKEAAAVAPTPDRTLDMGHDDAWLDRLARDIAQAAGNDGAIRFRLNPQTLGHLHVELSQGHRGTTVRMTTETEQARAILADAQPRLAAEARAQGVRIAESHVDLSGSGRQPSGDPRRQDDARQTPLIRTARGPAAVAPAPGRAATTRSDRFA